MAARILVIDNDRTTQRAESYTLVQEGYDVTVASSGPEGLRVWATQHPDLVLVDVVLPTIDGYEVAAKIRAERGSHHVPIVLLAPGTDVEHRVRGLRAGADDYLIRPFHPAELVARVKALLVRFSPKEDAAGVTAGGRVLAFYGAKGGAGTTTIMVNTGVALQRQMSRRVVMVDGKLQFGDLRVFLDIGLHQKSLIDLVTAPGIDVELLSKVVVSHDSGVDLLLAPPSPESAELVTHEHMPQILQLLRTMYDYVLVDLDQRLDEHNLQILDAAVSVILVMTADLPSLNNARLFLATMQNLGYDRDKIRLLLNRSTADTGVNVRNVEAALERPIQYQVINDHRRAISALNSGTPFMYRKPGDALSRSVAQFARAIDDRTPVVVRDALAAKVAPART